jgi:phosphate/sulfate permease
MMEVARKGIMNPSNFEFAEIMIIFMAVMITDIILLDVFNSLGLPTSTTVSIVFELLGASVSVALYKIAQKGQEYSALGEYINSDKALQIVSGILLSVVVAFTVGALVQYVSRFIWTFQFEKKIKTVGALFGGFAISAITYFIVIKGLKGSSFITDEQMAFVKDNTWYILDASFVGWSIINQILLSFFKINILKFIVLIGTFALAMAFAGNDLVNFIGVPMAGFESYKQYVAAGYDATIPMTALSKKVATPTIYLLGAGLVMVVTLWFSKKARTVSETELSLARQDEGAERFEPNFIARSIVRFSVNSSKYISKVVPLRISDKIESRFDNKTFELPRKKEFQPASFDLVRASVNLTVASILISVATSYKLPLSTTYVSFMVAMGTSLSDRAWDRESAVYRVAGVLNVIAGWFVTAFVAFTSAATLAYIINIGGFPAIGVLLVVAIILLTRSFILHKQKLANKKEDSKLRAKEKIELNEIVEESSDNISSVLQETSTIYSLTVKGLALEDRKTLKKSKKTNKALKEEMDRIKGNVFYFIKSMDETSVDSSKFYILSLDYLQDITQSIAYISKASFDHVNNQHKALKSSQIEDLKNIDAEIADLLAQIQDIYTNRRFSSINEFIRERKNLQNDVSKLVEKQITRIKTEESSPKNSMLYFSILLETKDLLQATWSLLDLYADMKSGE